MEDKMGDDDRRRKREKNNESVRKCRMNEKLKIQSAQEELIKYKKEYQELVEKYSSLQKELGTLRSLFQTSLSPNGAASDSPATSTSISNEQTQPYIVNNTTKDKNQNKSETSVELELDEILKNSDFLYDINLSSGNSSIADHEFETKKRKLDDT